MAQIGKVIALETVGKEVFVVIRGLGKIQDSQKVRNNTKVWTVLKKRWVKGDDASFLLKSLTGGFPEVGQQVELMLDGDFITIEGGHSLEVIDCFSLQLKNSVIQCVTLHGIAIVKPDDILTDGTAYWKITETSMSTAPKGTNRRFMVVVEAVEGSQIIPTQGSKLTKFGFDAIEKVEEKEIPKIQTTKKSKKTPTEPIINS